jgi:hypothetical protein
VRPAKRERHAVGILNNELYVGRLVWNRLRYLKDPDTGKRVSRLNPESEWIVQDVPELRIVDQELWDKVKGRQQMLTCEPTASGENAMNGRRRPKHLFAGLVKYGCCGGGYTIISKDLLGCATARNKGTCENRLNIRCDALEASVLSGLRTHLMEPGLFKEFCDEFTREVNRLRSERGADLEARKRELERVDRELDKAIQAILDGVPGAKLKDRIGALDARKAELIGLLANAEEPPPLLHPNMAEIFRQRISALHESLQGEDGKAEAAELFRTLVDQVTLVPEDDRLAIVLRGDLAAMLRFALGKRNPALVTEGGVLESLLSQESLVAGTGVGQNLHPSQVEMVAGGRNHQNLRTQKSRPVGAADLRDLVSQFEMVAGARNHLKLLFRAAA